MQRIYQHINNIINSITNKFDDCITAQRYDESLPDQVGIILSSSGGLCGIRKYSFLKNSIDETYFLG